MDLRIRWLGQSATELCLKTSILYIDPWLDSNPVCPIKVIDVERADVVAVTHGHFDHLGDALELSRRTGAKLICTPEIAWYADRRGIKRGEQAFPLGPGGSISFNGFKITMVPAVHPSALYGEEWKTTGQFIPDGGAVGIVVETNDGISVYHAGDTDLFLDMKLIAERYHPDIVLLPIGGRFTMNYHDAAIACSWLSPSIVIPIHFNTNTELRVEVADFVREIESKAIDTRVVVLKPGESYTYERREKCR